MAGIVPQILKTSLYFAKKEGKVYIQADDGSYTYLPYSKETGDEPGSNLSGCHKGTTYHWTPNLLAQLRLAERGHI
jgi:hypothetical protein